MENKKVLLTIEYYGHFQMQTQCNVEKLEVPANLKTGIGKVKDYLSLNYAINQGYIIFVNNDNLIRLLKTDETESLFETDVIKIIPVASGG